MADNAKAPYEIECRIGIVKKELVFYANGENVTNVPGGLEGLLSLEQFVYGFSVGADEVLVSNHVYRKHCDQVEGDYRTLVYRKV